MSAADEYFKKAEQAAKKGNWDYAIELCMQGLILNPTASVERRKLHIWEAQAVQEKGGNPQGGFGTKLKVMPLQANNKKLTMQKKWEEAAIEIEKCLRFQPQSSGTLFNLAMVLENLNAVDGAIVVLEEVSQLDKTNVEAYRKLGALWAKKDEPEKAIEFWSKVQQYKPDDKEAGKAIRDLSAATMVKRAEDRKKMAGDESFKALLKSEEEAADLEKKQKVIRTDEDRWEAIRLKKEELRKDPTNSRLWRELGMYYQELKEWAAAEKIFRKALEVNPHDLFVLEKIGALKEAKLDYELSVLQEACNTAKAAGQDSAELEARLKAKEAEIRHFKAEEYDRRVKAHPTDYELKVRYGEILMDVGKFDDAISQFQKAVNDPKLRIRAFNLIGTCFREKGLYQLAEQQYQKALDGIADKDSELGKLIQYNLALVCEKQQDKKKALGWYQKIMAIDIGYRDVSARVSALMGGDKKEG